MEDARWKKSSRSAGETNCVEVRADLAAIRDTKTPGLALVVDAAALVTAVKAGALRRLT